MYSSYTCNLLYPVYVSQFFYPILYLILYFTIAIIIKIHNHSDPVSMNHNLILKYHVYSFAEKSRLKKKEKNSKKSPISIEVTIGTDSREDFQFKFQAELGRKLVKCFGKAYYVAFH